MLLPNKIQNFGMLKMLSIFVIISLIGLVVETSAFETVCSAAFDVELDYTIDNGKVLETCAEDEPPVVFMTVESDVDSKLTVEIPRTLVYFVNQDCESQNLLVLINDIETEYNIENTPFSRIITLDFPTGYNAIEFIGSYTLGEDVRQYCGTIYGYDSQYLSPKKQIEKGRSAENIRCNEGLELILKNNNSPACVSPETKQKLIERGWAKNIE